MTFSLPWRDLLKKKSFRKGIIEEEQIFVVDNDLCRLCRGVCGREVSVDHVVHQNAVLGAADTRGICTGRRILVADHRAVDDVTAVGAVCLDATNVHAGFISGYKAIIHRRIAFQMDAAALATRVITDDTIPNSRPVVPVIGPENGDAATPPGSLRDVLFYERVCEVAFGKAASAPAATIVMYPTANHAGALIGINTTATISRFHIDIERHLTAFQDTARFEPNATMRVRSRYPAVSETEILPDGLGRKNILLGQDGAVSGRIKNGCKPFR